MQTFVRSAFLSLCISTLLAACGGNGPGNGNGDSMGDSGPGDSMSSGDTASGDTSSGDAATGDSAMGDPAMGDSAMGDTMMAGDAGDPACGEPVPIGNGGSGISAITPVYAASDLWMSYRLNDGADIFSSSGAQCDPNAVSRYDDCIHVSELRQATLAELSSCAEVQLISDSEGAFNWECDDTGGPVVVRTTGLADGKGLRDLIVGTTAVWKSMSVSVAATGSRMYITDSIRWWNNCVVDLEPVGPLFLNFSDRIFVINDNAVGNFNIAGNRVALITTSGVTITDTGVGEHAIRAYFDMPWIEADVVSTELGNGISIGFPGALSDTNLAVVRNSSVTDGRLTLDPKSGGAYVNNVMADGRNAVAVLSDDNVVQDVFVPTSDTAAVLVGASAANNEIRNVVVGTGDICLELSNQSHDNLVDGVSCASVYLGLFHVAEGNIVRNVVATYNPLSTGLGNPTGSYMAGARNVVDGAYFINFDYGVRTVVDIGGGALTNEGAHVLQDVRVSNSTLAGMSIESPNTRIINPVVVGSANGGIYLQTSSNVVLNATSVYNGIDETFALVEDAMLMNNFVQGLLDDTDLALVLGGMSDAVSMDDDGSGEASFDAIMSWGDLEHAHRAWGLNDASGPCISGQTCQIYDFTTMGGGLNIYTAPTAGGLIGQTWVAADEPECTFIGGTWSGTCTTQFHPLGYETSLVPGASADFDGLCEASEPCIRTRNLGAYQGHGALVPSTTFGSYTFYDTATNGR